MATPYALKKVPLQTSPKYSETEILRSEHLHCRPGSELELSRDDRLRFACATWCPVCEARQGSQCGSRRGKNEGLEADPLREHNRVYESTTDAQNCHKIMSRECDHCNIGSYDNRQLQNQTSKHCLSSPARRPNQFSEKKYPEFMDVDRSMDRPRMRGRPKAYSLSPVKKYKERILPSADNHRYHHRNYEPGTINVAQNLSHGVSNEHPGQFYNALDNSSSTNSLESDINGIGVHYRSNKVQSCNDLEQLNGGFPPLRIQPWVGHDSCSKHHLNGYIQSCADNRNVSSHRSREGQTCDVPSDNVEDSSRNVFHANKATVQDHYHREVEVLRGKLRALRSADKKRLRQRSESEPGLNYNSKNLQEFSWEAKRARDNSPHFLDFSEIHQVATSHSIPSVSSHRSSGRHAKLPPVPCKHKSTSGFVEDALVETPDESVHYDSDFENGDNSCEDDEEKEMHEEDSEDDQSVLSSLTTVSSDSNTSAVVRECLGSISLNDSPATSTSQVTVVVPPVTKKLKGLPQTLRSSLFSYVPPFIRFSLHDAKGDTLPFEIQRLLKWKLSTITPLVVRRTLVNTGFRLIRKSNDWCGTWGKHMKSLCFKTLKDFQKINHFPGTFQIGRKDRLWKNLQRLMAKFGKKEFGFIPRTFVLPQDNKLLRQTWENSCGKERWIIKPPASARGTGIKVIHRWNQIPKKRPLVVQRYISRPYLINGSKFDLRLYVLVTSINPLRIYLYDDGLVRFASVKYSDEMSSLGDRYMHLTNYSINKMSSQYTANEDSSACQGHKWTVKTLWSYLEKDGIDVGALKASLVDLVIKTIISGESSINQLTRANLNSRYASYELFGIDVLLDEELKPWLLEVNISPSLHSSSPLDLAVKGPMVRDLMNMAGYQIPNKLLKQQQDGYLQAYGIQQSTLSLCFDKRLYTMVLSRAERVKQTSLQQGTSREEYLTEVLQELTPDDVRHLIQSEDEITQQGDFVRIFPTPDTHAYLEFFEAPRYYNMLFDAWENKYHDNRQAGIDLLESKCQRKFHLTTPIPGGPAKCYASPTSSPDDNGNGWEDATEEKPLHEKKATNLSTVSLYRAARPRSGGRFGATARQYVRSKYLTRRPKSSTLPTCLAKCATSLDDDSQHPPLTAVTC